MRILALTKYGPMAASTRQRFVQYEPALAAAGMTVEYAPLLDDAHVKRLAKGKRTSSIGVASAYARRLAALAGAGRFEALWVHCELFPYLPAAFERLAFVHRRPVIYDYDDAIFHMYDDHPSTPVRALLGDKLKPLIRGASAVCAGNDYLRAYAAPLNPATFVLPTVVDTDQYRPVADRRSGPVTIGWIGSPSTWVFVRPILPLLADLCAATGARFTAVGAGPAAEVDRFHGMEVAEWREASEIASVQAMDVGIMPLPDAPWARGKCGYKLIQYMACGLPVVASPVGVNANIVREGTSGLLATDFDQWRAALTRLIDDPTLRQSMGAAGRARAVEFYSLQTHAPPLVDVMRRAAEVPVAR